MMHDLLIEALKGAIVGGLIGWATNQLAVSMLFHPRKPFKIGRWTVPLTPGLVEKNRDRLAEAIGRAVANDLLDANTLVAQLRALNLAEPLSRALAQERANLSKSSKTLVELAGPGHAESIARIEETIAGDLARRLAGWSQTVTGADSFLAVEIRTLIGDLARTPIGELVDADTRRGALRGMATALKDYICSDRSDEMARDLAFGAVESLAKSNAMDSLENVALDAASARIGNVVGAVQDKCGEYLRTETVARETSDRLGEKLHAIVIKKFPMAAMLLSRNTVVEMIYTRWDDIAAELESMIKTERFTQKLEQEALNAIPLFFDALRKNIHEGATLHQLANMISGESRCAMVSWLGTDECAEKLDDLLGELWSRTPEQLMGGDAWIDRTGGMIAGRLGGWMESERGQAAVAAMLKNAIEQIVSRRPVGELIEFIPEREWTILSDSLGVAFQRRADQALPDLIQNQLNIAQIVADRILDFDAQRIEETIQRVSGRELTGIVRLGGLIGIVVGALTQIAYYFMG